MTVELCTNKISPVFIPALPTSRGLECKRCEMVVNIGLFFDGTGNNRELDLPTQKQSNVARLYDAYREKPEDGFFRYYIEGIGTRCDLVNDPGGTMGGNAFGKGGKARILLGLLQVLNALHLFVNRDDSQPEPMFKQHQLQALCSDAPYGSYKFNNNATPYDELRKFTGLDSGLLTCNMAELKLFFLVCAQRLKGQLSNIATRPTVVSIYLDVFGFSRGAAEARVFVNWLNDFMMRPYSSEYSLLFGQPSYVRFLGLFDTVASVIDTPSGALFGSGHDDWANMRNLAVPPRPLVQQCVHFVALHELRNSFPADSVYAEGLPTDNCHERIGPGSHSDIGGGYAPGAQGKAIDSRKNPVQADDSYKLSQFYLHEMYEAARQSCRFHRPNVPWLEPLDKQAIANQMKQQFACAPAVVQAVQHYFDNCDVPDCASLELALQEHGMRYLAWRYQLAQNNGFEALPSAVRAWSTDPEGVEYYLMGQNLFKEQLAQISKNPAGYFHAAPAMLKRMKGMSTSLGLEEFFDGWVHDSYAGFLQSFAGNRPSFQVAEPQGYVRYRVLYQGCDDKGREVRRNAMSPHSSGARKSA